MESSLGRSRQRHQDWAFSPRLVTRAQNGRAGSYGVSVRVQGIDGHPYIVLNNTESCLSGTPENSQRAASESADGSMPESTFPAVELKEKRGEETAFGEAWSARPPSLFKSLKPGSLEERTKSPSLFKAGVSQFSSLLNCQRYPELLQPYSPENKVLNPEGLLPSPFGRPDERQLEAGPSDSSLKAGSSDDLIPRSAEPAKSKSKMADWSKPNGEEELSKRDSEDTGVADGPNRRHKSVSSGSRGAVSTTVCREPTNCRPDLLSFRQQDSAVPNGPPRSPSSTALTSAASFCKFFLDNQDCAIYADNVNRHENRRYIPFWPGTGRDIDTGSIPAVDELIEKFDRKVAPQRQGRRGSRNRIHPDDRKRSKSVDSLLSHGLYLLDSDYVDQFTKHLGTSSECLAQPSKVCLQKPLSPGQKSAPHREQAASRSVGKLHAAARARDSRRHHFSSLQYQKQSKTEAESLSCKSSTLPAQNTKRENKTVSDCTASQEKPVKTFAAASKSAQATPDLLKGQQELAQQTNEETAKQILYSYLKEGSSENDDATTRKVNLVFEKIQTLKSRAAGSSQASEASTEVKLLVEEKRKLGTEVSELRRKLDLEVRNQQNLKDEREAMADELQDLRRRLEESMKERDVIRRQLKESEKDLRQTLEELFQVKMEREQHQTEIRDLQDQLSEMHDELDRAKDVDGSEKLLLAEELRELKQDLQGLLVARDQQDEILRKRERELTALKGALKEEVSSHDYEMDRLKQEQGLELQNLRDRLAKATEEVEGLAGSKAEAEKMQRVPEDRQAETQEQSGHLRRALAELQDRHGELLSELERLRGGKEGAEERLAGSRVEVQRLEASLAGAQAEAQQLALARATLEAQLEAAQRDLGQLSEEQQQFAIYLNNEASQREQLMKRKGELEEERQQLDQTVAKLHQEMAEIIEVSQASTLELQNQLDRFKEKNCQEHSDSQQQLKERNLELEKARLAVLRLQEQTHSTEEELRSHQRAQEEALTKIQVLEQTVKALEYELDTRSHFKEDRTRQAKMMEDKMSQLELELKEERNNANLLSERIGRGREQAEQMRTELLQERALRKDLECDKISLERQNKDLRSQILHLEGTYRSSKEGLLVQMEARLGELEEQLASEERERAHLQLSNRRLERTVKELLMQVDDEHLSLTDQKDQLNLRLKAMKRQVDEAEEEIDRLESTKKKLQRELEEQVDLNDQLQGQLKAIRQELRRKTTSSKLLSDLDGEEEDFSTDGESVYDAPSGFKFLKQS